MEVPPNVIMPGPLRLLQWQRKALRGEGMPPFCSPGILSTRNSHAMLHLQHRHAESMWSGPWGESLSTRKTSCQDMLGCEGSASAGAELCTLCKLLPRMKNITVQPVGKLHQHCSSRLAWLPLVQCHGFGRTGAEVKEWFEIIYHLPSAVV